MLNKLKQFLKDQKIDFFLLPNSDEFFSEYLADNQKRIEHLTGFTGSNATVIFGQNKSLFFTDGRYTLQAKNQLDLKEFEIFNLAEIPLLSLVDNNSRLACDRKLTSVAFAKILQKKFPHLIFLDQELEIFHHLNLLQTQKKLIKPKLSWFERNHSEQGFFTLPDKITGLNSKDKINQILRDVQADAVILTKPENICWLLNIRGFDLEFTPSFLTYAILFKNGEVKLFKKEIPTLGQEIRKIQIDENATNYWLYSELQKRNLELINKTDPIDLIKSQKNPTEILGAIKAHEEDGLAVTKFLFWLSKQDETDEISAAKRLLEFRKESTNFFSESFDAISGFASNGAVIHYHSTSKTNRKFYPNSSSLSSFSDRGIQELSETNLARSSALYAKDDEGRKDSEEGGNNNSLYLIDSGGQYLGEDFCGTTDITRTIAIGTPNAEMIENFTRVLKGHIALARAKFPCGTTGAQLDVLAREHLWRAGLNYDHGTGHGVSSFLSVHEGPCSISKRAHQELLPNMILSNEPGFYKEGQYGIRIENLILVEEAKQKGFLQFRTLTLAPIDPNLIDFKMLTRPEKHWLKSYHQEILQKFSRQLNQEITNWLLEISIKYDKNC